MLNAITHNGLHSRNKTQKVKECLHEGKKMRTREGHDMLARVMIWWRYGMIWYDMV